MPKKKAPPKSNSNVNDGHNEVNSPCPVVGLGASAGGLEALEEFFKAMPGDSRMAFAVVMHQSAHHTSLLPELIGNCTTMPVKQLDHGMRAERDHVYIGPPGKHVDLLQGVFYLSDLPDRGGINLPIDHFFRSLAEDRRERAVAIVLSGTGTDGTVGVSAIKGESGLVIAQSIESAKFSGMPQNAINAGWADYVLRPNEMPERLVAYANGPFLKRPAQAPASALQLALPEILLHVRRSCGHDFSDYKASTIGRRIERRMNLQQIENPRHYLKFLQEDDREAEAVFRDLLIGVTCFFREPWAFEALAKKAILPRLSEKENDGSFRVWIPGCSSGEEAYSIAILLRECMDELKIYLNVQLFATDLDDRAIEAARLGIFPSGIGADVSQTRLNQFFTKEDSCYRIRKELRDWLVFAPQNVIHDPPFTKLDLISCRNLLIYMQPSLQSKLLTLFHYSLLTGGSLFLGTSETIGDFEDLYQVIDTKAKVFRRTEAVAARHPDHRVHFPVVGKHRDENFSQTDKKPESSSEIVQDAVTKLLAGEFAPPTVIVNDEGNIVHVHGRTGMFLELASGSPSQKISTMARDGLELDLTSALRKAARQTSPVLHKNVPVKTNGSTILIDLMVKKLSAPAALRGMLQITFLCTPDVPLDDEPVPVTKDTTDETRHSVSAREQDLERELQRSRELLQRTIEELDTSNEEMTSTNEELQSINEELQSTNEELETSKEELQSLNEELQTVNSEFQEKIHELSTANDDMTNLLNSTEIATLFLDNALNIKRYTEKAKSIVSVIPTDLGRSLSDLTSHLLSENLIADCEQVLATLIPLEQEVETLDGRSLLMRILPYRTSDDKIDGLVMTFVDTQSLQLAQDKLRVNEERFRAFLDNNSQSIVWMKDHDGRFVYINTTFEKRFDVASGDLVGKPVSELDKPHEAFNQNDFLALESGEVMESVEAMENPDGTSSLWKNVRVPFQDGVDAKYIGGIGIDVTQQLAADSLTQVFEQIVETIRDPMVVLDGDLRVQRANRAFYDTFRVTPNETEGQLIFELGNSQWNIPALRNALEDVLPKNASFDDFELIHDFPNIGRKRMTLNARRISTPAQQPSLILLAIQQKELPDGP